METIEKIGLVFTIVGAINWGLVGLFDLNLVTLLFQEGSFLTKLIYIIIGIFGVLNIWIFFKRIDFE